MLSLWLPVSGFFLLIMKVHQLACTRSLASCVAFPGHFLLTFSPSIVHFLPSRLSSSLTFKSIPSSVHLFVLLWFFPLFLFLFKATKSMHTYTERKKLRMPFFSLRGRFVGAVGAKNFWLDNLNSFVTHCFYYPCMLFF